MDINGVHLEESGSITFGANPTGIISSLKLTYAGQELDVSGAAISATSVYSSGDSFLRSIVSGNSTISIMGGSSSTLFGGYASAGSTDTLNGGIGVDTTIFSGGRSGYTITKSDTGYLVKTNAGGTDTLTNIERLEFSDKKIAIDLTPDGHAGQAMEFIGAVAPDLLNNTSIRGTIISLFDQGQTMESLSQLALNLNLLPTTSNADLANAVYHNVLGGTASTDMTNGLVGYIGAHGQANFLATVAGLHINVDLVGLQQTGVEYLI